jgi:hypothetical protein
MTASISPASAIMLKPRRSMLRTGTTTENQAIIAGVATLTNTHGLPLELVPQYFRDAAWRRLD